MTRQAPLEHWQSFPPPLPEGHPHSGLIRLLDGLAFRYAWSVEGLDPTLWGHRIAPGTMSLGELLHHILELAAWAGEALEAGKATYQRLPRGSSGPDLYIETLHHLSRSRHILQQEPRRLEEALLLTRRSKTPVPGRHLVSGPWADALTHVGQVRLVRRHAGDPAPAPDVLRGNPPQGWPTAE